jgi:hypothetical protein
MVDNVVLLIQQQEGALASGEDLGGPGPPILASKQRVVAREYQNQPVHRQSADRSLGHCSVQAPGTTNGPDAWGHSDDPIEVFGRFRRIQSDIASEGLPGQNHACIALAPAGGDFL